MHFYLIVGTRPRFESRASGLSIRFLAANQVSPFSFNSQIVSRYLLSSSHESSPPSPARSSPSRYISSPSSSPPRFSLCGPLLRCPMPRILLPRPSRLLESSVRSHVLLSTLLSTRYDHPLTSVLHKTRPHPQLSSAPLQFDELRILGPTPTSPAMFPSRVLERAAAESSTASS